MRKSALLHAYSARHCQDAPASFGRFSERYSPDGGRRSCFVLARRRFDSRRRSRAVLLGFVATRRRGTASAWRSFSTSRSTASSRFRAWLRSSCAIARNTGPALRGYPSLLHVRQRRRCLDVEDRLDARRGLLSVLAARPARARDPELDLRNGQGDGACDPNSPLRRRRSRHLRSWVASVEPTAHRLTLHGLHSAGHRRRAPRLGRADPGRRRSGRRAARGGPRAPLRLEQLDPPSSPAGRGASPHGVHARRPRAADAGGRSGARAGRQAGAGARDDVDRPRPRRARARGARLRRGAHRRVRRDARAEPGVQLHEPRAGVRRDPAGRRALLPAQEQVVADEPRADARLGRIRRRARVRDRTSKRPSSGSRARRTSRPRWTSSTRSPS